MKTKTTFHSKSQGRRTVAFTLMELMVGMSIFAGILVGSVIGLQIFGMKVYILAATKMTSTTDARQSLNSLRSHIRSAKKVYVGNYTNETFSLIPYGEEQEGNALEMFFLDTNDEVSDSPIIYYQSDDTLYSITNQVVTKLAGYVTNYNVFRAEDYRQQPLSTRDNNRVICVTLNFYQWEYPIGVIGTNGINAYNFYRLQTRVTRRAKE